MNMRTNKYHIDFAVGTSYQEHRVFSSRKDAMKMLTRKLGRAYKGAEYVSDLGNNGSLVDCQDFWSSKKMAVTYSNQTADAVLWCE